MKDWLNDKKNLPIIGAVTALIVIGALVMAYRTLSGGGSATPQPMPGPQAPTANNPNMPTPTTTPTPTPMPSPTPAPIVSTPGGATPGASTPAAAPSTQEKGGEQKTALLPYRADPFLPFDYKPPSQRSAPRVALPPIGPLFIPNLAKQPVVMKEVLPPQPQRRMAGILHNGKVYAILETGGDTIVVKPGDIVENGNVRVDSIEPDKIMLSWLRTTKPIPIEVRMSEGTIVPEESGVESAPSIGPIPPPTSPSRYLPPNRTPGTRIRTGASGAYTSG